MLTPFDIEAHEFLVSLRGYDRDEVHAFLTQVANHIRDLQGEIEQLAMPARPVPKAAAPPDAFEALGKTTQRILEAAREAGSEIERQARGAADEALDAARALAGKVVSEGQRRRQSIDDCVTGLENRRTELAQDLRSAAGIMEDVLASLEQRGTGPTAAQLREIAQIVAPDSTWTPPEPNGATATSGQMAAGTAS